MSHIKDLAFNLNLSSGVPGMPQTKNPVKFNEYAKELCNCIENSIEEILSINNNEGYHVGTAFSYVVNWMQDSNSGKDINDFNTKFKLSLYCAIISLWKGIQVGNMQSVMASHTLIHLIDTYKDKYLFTQFYRLTEMSVGEIINLPHEETNSKAEKIYKYIKYYLIQLTRAQDAFKDANLNTCKLGKKYMEGLHDEISEDLNGYLFLGVI